MYLFLLFNLDIIYLTDKRPTAKYTTKLNRILLQAQNKDKPGKHGTKQNGLTFENAVFSKLVV